MKSKRKRTRRRAPQAAGELQSIAWLPVVVLMGGVALAAMWLLVWPVLVGLQRITDCCFIPHASGTYLSMNGLSGRGLLEFGADGERFDLLTVNAPIGFIALFWWLFVFGAVFSTVRAESRWAPARGRCLLIAAGTAVALLSCLPFVRQYEILAGRTILVKHFFDWNEQAYPLDGLTRIHRSVTGRGLVTWKFGFSDGREFTMTWPSREALAILLAQPHVQANVRIVAGRVEDNP